MYHPEILYLLGRLRHRELLRQAEQAHLIALALENRSGNRRLGQNVLAWMRARLPEKKRKEDPRKLHSISDRCCTIPEM